MVNTSIICGSYFLPDNDELAHASQHETHSSECSVLRKQYITVITCEHRERATEFTDGITTIQNTLNLTVTPFWINSAASHEKKCAGSGWHWDRISIGTVS